MTAHVVLLINFISQQEVIRDALLRGCLPLAQSYLIQRGPQDVVRLTNGKQTCVDLMRSIRVIP